MTDRGLARGMLPPLQSTKEDKQYEQEGAVAGTKYTFSWKFSFGSQNAGASGVEEMFYRRLVALPDAM